MADDWNFDYSPRPYQPSGLSRGMSHLSTVLDALLQRKSAEEQQRRALEQQSRLAAVDDARLQQQANEQERYHIAEIEAKQQEAAAKAEEQQRAANEKATPNILSALEAQNPMAAQMHAQAAGGKAGYAPRTTVPENAVGDMLGGPPQAPAGPDLSALPGPFSLLGAADMARQRAQKASAEDPLGAPSVPQAPAYQATPQDPPQMRVELPGQAPVDYDPEAIRQGRLQRGGQLAGDLGGIAGPGEFDQRAMADVQRMAKSGAYKSRDEMLADYTKQKNFYELQANENIRNARSAAAMGGRTDKAHPPGELNLPDLNGKTVGQALSPTEGHTIRAAQPAVKSLIGALGKMQGLIDSSGTIPVIGGSRTNLPFTQANKDMSSAQKYAAGFLTRIFETGVMSDKEYERYVNMMNPSLWQSPEQAKASLQQLITEMQEWYSNKLAAQGVHMPAQAAVKTSAKDTAKSLAGEIDQ